MSDFSRTQAAGERSRVETDAAAPAWVMGRSAPLRRIAQHLERVSEVQCTVLVSGETGTGKEVLATLLHRSGPRANRPFVPVNCAALTVSLAESQLFGHEKGAFTGASGSSLGVFRAAEGGIVFLDEVGEMPLELQPKLLRVLQQAEVTPVGSAHPVSINVQVIAATNRNLEDEVEAGRFREDLYYRLNMVELRLPALRERQEDIPEFIRYFSDRYARQYNRPQWEPSAETLRRFENFPWPGNVRQLAHVIQQAYVLDCEPVLPEEHAPPARLGQLPSLNLGELRQFAVRQALVSTGGHKGRAARLLGIHANTLTRMLQQMRLEGVDLPSTN